MSELLIQNLFSVQNKVVLITGGSRGIGLMMAKTFVENGAKVYISSRKAEVCDQVATELSEIGPCISVPADLAIEAGRKVLVNTLKEAEEKLDVLINNAGAAWGAPFAEFPESGYDRVMDLNVKSMFYMTQDLLPMLEASASFEDPARIINIGSIDGLHVSPLENAAYGVSKAAVHHLTQVLAVKFGGKNITVNAIAPGPFPSKMTAFMMGDDRRPILENANPMRRVGTTKDMGGIAVFLSSQAGSYLNGAVIPIDGGVHLS